MSPIDDFRNTLETSLTKWGVELTSEQFDKMSTHYLRLVEANQRCNLTRIANPIDSAVLHYADSLALLACPHIQDAGRLRVVDIGTGAGFPSVPLAIARPEWNVTALDSTRKKVAFVESVAQELNLNNLRYTHANTAHWKTAERFDLVVTRAFGALAECLRQSKIFLAPGGWIITYKTPKMSSEERQEADRASRELKLSVCEPFIYKLELRGETHERLLDVRRRT